MSHSPLLIRANRALKQHPFGWVRASLLTTLSNSSHPTPSSDLTPQSQPRASPSLPESQQTSPPIASLDPSRAPLSYAPELRPPSKMNGYKPLRRIRKKRQQQAASKAAIPKEAAPVETLVDQAAISGLVRIQQAKKDASLLRPPPPPPTQPAAMSRSKSKPKSNSKEHNGTNDPKRPPTPPAPPSASSGGVPDPTPQYIAQALLNQQALQQPRRILIIMDLNGTLLHRPNKRRPFHFVERPHARAFLNYCLETFYVAIWSSARPENVSKMVAQLLTPAQRDRCLLIWARDRFGLSPSDYNSKVQVYKRLTSVWSNPHVMASHPSVIEGGRWDQTNTVLVDDSLEKARSEPFNLLQLPEFSGLATEEPHVLPQVHDYLNSLSYQCDISRFMRISPFKLDPSYKLQRS